MHSPGVADTKKKVGMNKLRRLSFITLVYRFGRTVISRDIWWQDQVRSSNFACIVAEQRDPTINQMWCDVSGL